jgi:Domain of unknown function (DUF1707)
MSASSPAWILAATRRRTGYADMRISDAERAEVADLLSKHYGDGRLDQAEFDQRLDQAMKAKTYKDLSGLFADLPQTDTSDTSRAAQASDASRAVKRGQHQHRNHRVLFLVLVIAIAVTAGHALAWAFTPWVWIGLVGMIVLYAIRPPGGTP